MNKRLIFTVTNDLTYDQRMHRICGTLSRENYEVLLVGRKRKHSVPLQLRKYSQKRLNCFFEYGKLFYIEYNIRLFFFLLFRKSEVICAIDLDTIAPCYIAARLTGRKIIFDAHEYFTELIEVVRRPVVKGFWKLIEQVFVPRCDKAYTVSESLAYIFEKKYKRRFNIIRNLSVYEERHDDITRTEKYFVYAGAVNEGRGLEQFIHAMQYIDARFYVCGDGDILQDLVLLTRKLGLQDKVKFFGYVEPENLKTIIRNAYAGCLLLDKRSQSYYYSLANKFFDYIHAGIPQITISFPEYIAINKKYHVAELVDLDVDQIVNAANKILNDNNRYQELVRNTIEARKELNWQKESRVLLDIYNAI